MKIFLTGLIIGALLSGAFVWRFTGTAPDGEAKQEEKPKERTEHAKDGTVSVKLEEEEQKQMGLHVEAVAVAKLADETRTYGRVLNAAELPLMLAEIDVAEIALKGSRLTYDRLKRLNGEAGTVSEQKVEEANEAVKKDEVALQAAKIKLTTAWGQAVAQRANLEDLARQIAANEAALIRLDFPPGENTPPKSVRVALPGSEDHSVLAEILGPAPAADPITQSSSLVCLVKAKAWVPGAALVGWFAGEPQEAPVLSVPRTALLRHEGAVFVYQRQEEEFKRVPVELARSSGKAWLIRADLKEGDEVVTRGAQQVLAEELKSGSAED